jgi:hypothetical protein
MPTPTAWEKTLTKSIGNRNKGRLWFASFAPEIVAGAEIERSSGTARKSSNDLNYELNSRIEHP